MNSPLRHGLFVDLPAILAVAGALAVMFGWVIHSEVLVQIIPSSAPMQFNTALCFLLFGLSFWAIQRGRTRLTQWLAGTGVAFASVTLSQYIFHTNYGIDTIFIHPFTSVHTIAIGRMAPNTALGFIFLGVAILLRQRVGNLQSSILLALFWASLSAAIGLVPLLGYISALETAYGWENFAHMAIHTALLMTLLSTGIIANVLRTAGVAGRWLPLPVSIGLIVVAIAMALAVRSQEQVQLAAYLESSVYTAAQNTGEKLKDIDHALERTAMRWQLAGGTNRPVWESNAEHYIKDYPMLHLLGRYDATGHLLWQTSQPGADIPAVTEALQTIIGHNETDGLVALPNHATGYVRLYPLAHAQSKDGMLVAIIDLSRLFDKIAVSTLDTALALEVSTGDRILYSSSQINAMGDAHWRRTFALEGKESPEWSLTITPSAYFLSQHQSRIPWVVLGMGLLTALFVCVSLSLMLQHRRDAMRLKESKVRLRAIFSDSADGIALIDRKGNIESFNPACEKLFGYTQAEVLGKNVKILMPEPYHREHDGYLKHYQDTGERRIIGSGREVKGKRKDGSIFDIDLRVSELQVPDKKLFMGTFRDITERLHSEYTKQQLVDKLTDSNTELERFAYVASHDLREPLRIVANFADLLADEYYDTLDTAGREYVACINESATRMHGMVGDLLEYARIGNEEKRFLPVDMNVEMKHVLENLAAFIEEHNAFVTSVALPTVMGNPVQLMRVLQNLVGNAIKFHSPDAIPHVTVRASEGDKFWEFYVRDNGIGMASEYTRQIFEPFRQLHARHEYMGTGIGLAICKRIVEKHGGTIWVESTPGSGSVFHFTIPKAR